MNSAQVKDSHTYMCVLYIINEALLAEIGSYFFFYFQKIIILLVKVKDNIGTQ